MDKSGKLSVKNGIITTVAGGGASTADGVPATSASLYVENFCVDAIGNIYIPSDSVIRRIDAITDIITTLPYRFGNIAGICSDGPGNIYISDAGSDCIRKIAAGTGIANIIAGTGATGYTGDGGPATDASLSLFESSTPGSTIYPVLLSSLISVSATGDVFFVDQDTSVIRKINAATGIISTIAGNTTGVGPIAGATATTVFLGRLTGFCTGDSGNIYCNEISCDCRKMDMATDSIYSIGGSFYTTSFRDDTNSNYAWMNTPAGLCADAAGNIYVADLGNNRIRKLILETHVPTFALGEKQSINPCNGTVLSINRQMSITDLDSGQLETWTVLNAPVSGAISGFPFTKLSWGTDSLTLPTGMFYTPATGFTGADSFRIQVSDGTFADTVVVYVNVGAAPTLHPISGSSGVCAGTTVRFIDGGNGGAWSVANGRATITVDTLLASSMPEGMLSAIRPGEDTVFYTYSQGCTMVASFPISIVGMPVVGMIIGGDSVCLGASATFADTTAGGVWTASDTFASVSTSGVVHATSLGSDAIYYTITNACGSISAEDIISIQSPLVPESITGRDSLCEGSKFSLPVSRATGPWSATNTNVAITDSGIIIGLSVGWDTIMYTQFNACGSASAREEVVVVDCATLGLSNVSTANAELNVYPNPASSVLNIEWTKWSAENDVVIDDISGREILRHEFTSNNNTIVQINISNLNPGIYFVKINGAEVRKFVKE